MPTPSRAARPDSPGPRLADWLRASSEVTDLLASARGLPDAVDGILRAVGEALDFDFGAIWAADVSAGTLRPLGTWVNSRSHLPLFEARTNQLTLPRGNDLPGQAWTHVAPVSIENLAEEREFPRARAAAEETLGEAVAAPLRFGESVYGVLEFAARGRTGVDEARVTAVDQVARQMGQFVAREEAVRNLVRSRRDLADLFEKAPVGIHIADAEGRIVRTNRVELEMLGYTRDEYVGRSWTEFLVEPAALDPMWEKLLAARVEEEVVTVEVRLRCKDRSVKWVRCNANASWDDGRLVQVRVFTRDITQVREAEEERNEMEQRLRRLVEGVREYSLHALDPQGKVTSWNSGGNLLYGYTSAEILGRDCALLFSEEQRVEDLPARLLRLAADEGAFQYEGWRVRKDGSRFWAEVVYTAARDAEGRLVELNVLTRDLSQRRRLEALRKKSNDLDQQNREVLLAARRTADLLRGVATAVERPLSEVDSAMRRLRDSIAEGARQPFQRLDAAVDGLKSALQNLESRVLDEAHAEAGPEPIDLLRVSIETRDMLRDAAAARRIRVETDVDPSLDDVATDEARIRLVTYNFLSNAIKFSRERGRVSVRMLPEGDALFRIEVEDSGIGLSEAEIADALRTPEPNLEGAVGGEGKVGIGLAATKQIAEQLGGRIGVHSLPGRGSVFFAVLPRTPARAAREEAEAREPAAEGAPRRDRRVLVVAEDASTRAGLCWTLGHAGYEVISAVGAEEGLHIARERRCEVIAVDLLLETVPAVEFVATVRAEGSSREVPCIVAAIGSPGVGVAGMLATDLLPRPAPADRLFASLERARIRRGSSVLISDADLGLCRSVAQTVELLGYRALPRPDAHEALRTCAEEMPAGIVLSPFLLGLDPFAFLHHLRQLPRSRELPVLLLVPRTLDEAQLNALQDASEAAAREGLWHRGLILEGTPTGCLPTPASQA